ncbi:MAG: hypothetical protein K2X29_10000 [Candidatus Obscuribacterales bacterium]|nr:hypothetical protein [Candidatus Obscuribacterales bacterium]
MDKQSAAIEVPEHPSGLLYRLLTLLKLAVPGIHASGASALFFIGITWLPMLVMALMEGTALPGKVHVPFLLDYSSISRYLIAGPVILISEPIVRPWMKRIIKHFLACHIIPPESIQDYRHLVDHILRLQTTPIMQVFLLVVSFVTSIISADVAMHAHISTWQTTQLADGKVFSMAGNFQNMFSQPIFRFLWLEALYQYGLWVYFLMRMARFPLTVHPTHADAAGGLGFIGAGQTSFTLLAFAMSCGLTGAVERLLRIHPTRLIEHWDILAVWVGFMFLLFLGPLLAFTPMLAKAKRDALFSYGKLSHNASYGFGKHWIASDIQESDIDDDDTSCQLDHSNIAYQAVTNMRPFVFGRQVISVFAMACVLPAVPLILSQIPWAQILEKVRELKEYI